MKNQDLPESLKPFEVHGLDLQPISGKEYSADCPFCGREGKFSVNYKDTKWKCWNCDANGNNTTFLEQLWEKSSQEPQDYSELAGDRGLEEETLEAWGIVRNVLTRVWLVPGHNSSGKVNQLYRYVSLVKGEKRKLLATPGISHQLHGVNLYNPKKKTVFLCEGPWDAMKLWETLRRHREQKGKYIRTKRDKGNLLTDINVLAVPGCTTFHNTWRDVFIGKKVYIIYDNDHPRKGDDGKLVPPAGYVGVQKASSVLNKGPSEIAYLRWGPKGYDPKIPNNFDVRDFLKPGNGSLPKLLAKMAPVPEEWKRSEKEKKQQQLIIKPKECTEWVKVSNQWRKAMKWSEGLDTALSVMLASVVSTKIPGDQLWLKIIGPPSSGKTTLCEAISIAKDYVYAKDTISNGILSGYQSDKEGAEDHSPVENLRDKTFAVKDADTITSSDQLAKVLSQFRALYDRSIRSQYLNKMSRDHENIDCTVILCGTSSLRQIDSSELGERFLDCVIMHGIDEDLEDEVLLRVVEKQNKNMSSTESTGSAKSPEEVEAMRLTGGYVEYLRRNDTLLVAQVTISEEFKHLITRIAKFVAYMRARPSTKQQENAEREFAARLVGQHLRLAKCLAAVLGRKQVNKKVMKRVIKVAKDTARGKTLEICEALFQVDSASQKWVQSQVPISTAEVRKLLIFLRAIGVTEMFTPKRDNIIMKPEWRLTERFRRVFEEVHDWENQKDE